MSLPSGLLDLARRLLTLDPRRPRQATLRRAVSTAYYALFHLLAEEFAAMFVAESDVVSARLSRSVDHKPMREVSGRFLGGTLPEGLKPFPPDFIPDALKRVANAFVTLQKARHDADYDRAYQLGRLDASERVRSAETAFTDWKSVRGHDAARLYLGCFLLWKTWNDKEPR
jgi:hypothetical protein